MHIDTGTVLGFLGVGFSLASMAMKNMRQLRVIALVSNVSFLAYGYVEMQFPSLIVNGVLLPLNALRLWELTKLTKEIASATQDSPVSQWLLPHMQHSSFKAGEVLFRKGDIADKLIYVAEGQLKLAEIDLRVGRGELIGEIGIFSPDKKRTQTLICETDGELYYMTDEMIIQLYYQNPKLGFYFMRMVAGRLLKDLSRSEAPPAAA
jgi:CRP/FNR family cyclic AMP-dependent transcriptional regulator